MNQILSIIAYVLGIGSVPTNAHLWKPARLSPAAAITVTASAPAQKTPLQDNSLRSYTYVFEGKATYRGQACPQASVLVRVTTSREQIVKGVVTEADGSYSVAIPVKGSRYEPVDWNMEAYTPESQRAELIGRRIVMQEDQTVVVSNPVSLQAF